MVESKIKEEGKAQESIQSRTAPNDLTRDTIWESDKYTREHYTQETQEVNCFQAGDHKAARSIHVQDSIIQTNVNNNRKDTQEKHHIEMHSRE